MTLWLNCSSLKAWIKPVPDDPAIILPIRIALRREAENAGIPIQPQRFLKILQLRVAEDFGDKAECRGSALTGDDSRISR